jgi:tetrahydromethanopterin S-methyltransferase subunit A
MVETIEAQRDKAMKYDPAGFFVIYLDEERDEIVAEHYLNISKDRDSPSTGKLNQIITGTSAEAICHTISRMGLITRPEHSAYVGRELQKADIAISEGIKYAQDEPLDFRAKRKRTK